MWRRLCCAAVVGGLVCCVGTVRGQGPDAKEVQAVLNKAIDYLKAHQNPDGSFAPKLAGPGVTALVVAALIRNGVSTTDPVVAKGLKYLESQVKADGGVYSQRLANYTTSVALMAFKEANKGGKYDKILKDGAQFLKGLQKGGDEKSQAFGGFGYDAKSRPDLSNTNFTIDALIAAGVSRDDPAIQNALKFISRCQNLPGETNNLPFAQKASKDDRGGFIYDIEADDSHKTEGGGLRSLGGMTYGGLKSFLYAGVGKDDPRVKAALDWIRRHWTLNENPGMGNKGLYYYYHTFGKAMEAYGDDEFADAKGTKHDWRRELFEALKSRQRTDGSWSNEGDRTFMEANPDLATAFAVLSLSYTLPPANKR